MGKKGKKKETPFSRPSGNASYRPKIHLISEGKETEPAYIHTIKELLRRSNREIPLIDCCKPKDSSIRRIVEKAKSEESAGEDGDQIWVAVDRDSESHPLDQMRELRRWEEGKPCKPRTSRHVAYSAPRFEFWLLLHFENSPSEADAMSNTHVEKYIRGYSRNKKWNPAQPPFSLEDAHTAISRAKHYVNVDYCEPPVVGTTFGKLAALLLAP